MGGGAGGVGDINHLAAAQSRDFPQQGSFPHHVAPSPGRGEVDPGVMRQLTGMGFPEERATQACLATRNSGVLLRSTLPFLGSHMHLEERWRGTKTPQANY